LRKLTFIVDYFCRNSKKAQRSGAGNGFGSGRDSPEGRDQRQGARQRVLNGEGALCGGEFVVQLRFSKKLSLISYSLIAHTIT